MRVISQRCRYVTGLIAVIFALTISATISASSAPALAQGGDKIYLVDMQKVISDSIAGKAAQADLQEEAKKRELKLQQVGQQLKEMSEQLEKQSSLLSKDAVGQKREDVVKKQKELERSIQDQREAMAKKRDEALTKVVTEARKAVEELAASRKIQVILERDPQFVLYSDDNLDITSDVIKLLDSKKLSQ